MPLTTKTTISAFVGTPQMLKKAASGCLWYQGPLHLIEDPLPGAKIAMMSALGPHYVGNFQDCPNSPFTDERLTPLIAEEKISFSIFPSHDSSTLLSVWAIRRKINRTDAKIISRQCILPLKDNMTELRVLHNAASTLNGAARTLGAVLVGFGGARAFKSRHLVHQLDCVGGCALIPLAALAQASTAIQLNASLRLIYHLLRSHTLMFKELDRINGYLLIANFLKKRRHLMSPAVMNFCLKICVMPPWNFAHGPSLLSLMQPDGSHPSLTQLAARHLSHSTHNEPNAGNRIDSSSAKALQMIGIELKQVSSKSVDAPLPAAPTFTECSHDWNQQTNAQKCVLNESAFKALVCDLDVWVSSPFAPASSGPKKADDETPFKTIYSLYEEIGCQSEETSNVAKCDFVVLSQLLLSTAQLLQPLSGKTLLPNPTPLTSPQKIEEPVEADSKLRRRPNMNQNGSALRRGSSNLSRSKSTSHAQRPPSDNGNIWGGEVSLELAKKVRSLLLETCCVEQLCALWQNLMGFGSDSEHDRPDNVGLPELLDASCRFLHMLIISFTSCPINTKSSQAHKRNDILTRS
ncbi:WD repeat and FYVE domain-containing protein 3, partial [Cichlidogyrus casuarinus]